MPNTSSSSTSKIQMLSIVSFLKAFHLCPFILNCLFKYKSIIKDRKKTSKDINKEWIDGFTHMVNSHPTKNVTGKPSNARFYSELIHIIALIEKQDFSVDKYLAGTKKIQRTNTRYIFEFVKIVCIVYFHRKREFIGNVPVYIERIVSKNADYFRTNSPRDIFANNNLFTTVIQPTNNKFTS